MQKDLKKQMPEPNFQPRLVSLCPSRHFEPIMMSKASTALENELLRRKFNNLKDRNEHIAAQLRAKDMLLRAATEEAKRECRMRLDAESRNDKAADESQAVERMVTTVRDELDAVRASAAALTTATSAKDGEWSLLVSEVDDLTRHVSRQEDELKTKAAEIGALTLQVETLKREVAAGRAAATLAENIAAQTQATLTQATDKSQRLVLRLGDVEEQLRQERILVATLRTAVVAAEAATSSAKAAAKAAAEAHTDLLTRLHDRERDVASLTAAATASAAAAATLNTARGSVDGEAAGVKRSRAERDGAPAAAAGGGTTEALPTPPAYSSSHHIQAPVGKQPPVASVAASNGCPLCTEAAFGLMLSCSSCMRCVHSSCARKAGHGKGSGPLLCPACVA